MIEPFQERHLEELLDVWYRASRQTHPFLTEDFLRLERKAIVNQYLPRAQTWVFLKEDRIAGFIALTGNEVSGLFVDPNVQGQGIGHALLDNVADHCKELEVDVFRENVIGRHFYDGYGFEVVDERSHDQTGHTLLRMRYEATGTGP